MQLIIVIINLIVIFIISVLVHCQTPNGKMFSVFTDATEWKENTYTLLTWCIF